MNPAIWGLMSAASWGTADFVARISGQALGPARSLLGMIASGIVCLVIYVVARDLPLPLTLDGVHWLVINGLAIMASMLLLYAGLYRGPVSIAAPLVGSYPVFAVLGSIALGIIPTATQWVAMVVVMLGVYLVAVNGPADSHGGASNSSASGNHTRTIVYSLTSAVCFAIGIFAAREAVPIYGDVQSVLYTRVISLVGLLAVMAFNRETPTVPLKWWPAVTAQGILDTFGMLTMFIGSVGDGAPLAAVGSAPVAVFTVLLTRIFLGDHVPPKQWIGIVLVVGAGAALAYVGHA